ncbi:hypothetical protein [Flavobacterium restrictum]|uniref:Uncharacterized protein n=1 Tax=Flavobacterium restrictum TaxID=2594428 RepID=A0A553DV66_9FLAO|nr:hypothetical protein [Flavobacterium restrictum]TRX36652.1 hypothetical protein FNW21_13075 [Flavobacterium restrictum]
MYLEDYRHNDYQLLFLRVLSYSDKPQIELTYNEYSNHGFSNTMFDIKDLENQDNFINNGRRNTLSISMWFLALEAYINALCKVTAIIKQISVDEIIKKEISGRIAFLIEELGYNKMKIKKTGVFNRVNEFRRFRNEIFHDRHSGEELKFEKTLFSSIPIRSGQVDVFQSLQIFLEVTSLFRFAIPGLDLMPNIAVGNEAELKFEKLDTIYSRFLAPFFQRVLIKRKLEIELELSFTLYQLDPSAIFKVGEIIPITKILQDEKYNISNLPKTNLGEELYNLILNSNESTTGLNFIKDFEDLRLSKLEMRG